MVKFTGNFPLSMIEEGRFPYELTLRDWLISIDDPDRGWVNVKQPFARIERFKFWDIEDDQPGAMTDEQAERMAKFIREARAPRRISGFTVMLVSVDPEQLR